MAPMYDYKCPKCSNEEVVVKSFADYEREELCPKCKEKMERQINRSSSFQLKGSGWYKDGYK